MIGVGLKDPSSSAKYVMVRGSGRPVEQRVKIALHEGVIRVTDAGGQHDASPRGPIIMGDKDRPLGVACHWSIEGLRR